MFAADSQGDAQVEPRLAAARYLYGPRRPFYIAPPSAIGWRMIGKTPHSRRERTRTRNEVPQEAAGKAAIRACDVHNAMRRVSGHRGTCRDDDVSRRFRGIRFSRRRFSRDRGAITRKPLLKDEHDLLAAAFITNDKPNYTLIPRPVRALKRREQSSCR